MSEHRMKAASANFVTAEPDAWVDCTVELRLKAGDWVRLASLADAADTDISGIVEVEVASYLSALRYRDLNYPLKDRPVELENDKQAAQAMFDAGLRAMGK